MGLVPLKKILERRSGSLSGSCEDRKFRQGVNPGCDRKCTSILMAPGRGGGREHLRGKWEVCGALASAFPFARKPSHPPSLVGLTTSHRSFRAQPKCHLLWEGIPDLCSRYSRPRKLAVVSLYQLHTWDWDLCSLNLLLRVFLRRGERLEISDLFIL